MSLRDEKILSLLGTNLDKLSDEELKKLCKKILKSKIHGICFSLYEGDQQPGDIVSDDQIIRRLKILKPYTTSIRTFSSLGEHSRIVEIAKDMGFKTLVGAWLSDDFESNDKEIEGLIQLANKGLVDVAAVYYEFRDRPNITNACDVILANCYPFWEGCAAEYSLLYMKDMFNEGAHPSYRNYLKYFINAQLWSKEKDIEMFYFSSFDESWKVDAEGDVGAYWS